MSGLRPVHSVHTLCQTIVAMILHCVWAGVIVIMTTLSMLTEAVSVVNTKVQVLSVSVG